MNTEPDEPPKRRKTDLNEDKRADASKVTFALANIAPIAISLAAGLASNTVFDKLDNLKKFGTTGILFVNQLHWAVLFTAAIVLYSLTCILVEFIFPKSIFSSVLKIPSWTELRNFGNQQIAKISYLALGAIPMIVSFIVSNPFNMPIFATIQVPLNLKISFFIAFFFSIALISFVIGCPKEFTPKKSAFDKSRNVNMLIHGSDRSIVQVTPEPEEFYDAALDKSRILLRGLCWTFYTLGLSFAVVLLFRSARLVLLS